MTALLLYAIYLIIAFALFIGLYIDECKRIRKELDMALVDDYVDTDIDTWNILLKCLLWFIIIPFGMITDAIRKHYKIDE